MLTLNIKPIFEARNIERPYSFLVKAGLTSITAHNLLNSKSSSIRFDHIELLCRILICEPSDLFVWRPNKNENINQDHPLTKLREQEIDKTIQETLSKLPYKKLKEVTKQIRLNQVTELDESKI
jgi:DNA-binding Xre family transcriptional regulator